MRIAFDCDGVLTNFEKNVWLVAEELWPGKMPKGYTPTDWDYTDGFTKKEWNEVWAKIRTIPDFWLRQPPMIESVQALKEFRLINDSPIWFITSRQATGGVSAKYQTQLWLLQRQLIGIGDLEKVIAVSKPEEKEQYIRDLKIDYSIDDLGSTVERHNKIPNHRAILLDQPWNKDCKEPRVYSVKEFLEVIS
jgi:hypothetical protein